MSMPPLPPPTPSIKLTLEGLATLLGLKVCSHGDLGFAFGSGPVLASHEAVTIIREVVANLRARAREEGEAAESLRAQLAELEYQRAEGRNRLATFLDAPTDETVDQLTSRIRDLLEIRDRYTAVKVRAEADELEIKKLLESLRVTRSAEAAKAEEVDALYKMIDALAPKLPSCSEPHVDRLARAQRKIAAASLDRATVDVFLAPPAEALEPSTAPKMQVVGPALRRGSAQASGLDLPVRLGVSLALSLAPGRTVRVPTGVRVAIPEGFEGQVRPRSSAAAHGLLVHLGTIDADYRGEIEVIVTNLSGEWVSITKSVAQLVICPTARPPIEYVELLDETSRGEGGFGSSDVIAEGGYTIGSMVVVGKGTR